MSVTPQSLFDQTIEIEALMSLILKRHLQADSVAISSAANIAQEKINSLLADLQSFAAELPQNNIPSDEQIDIAIAAGFEQTEDAISVQPDATTDAESETDATESVTENEQTAVTENDTEIIDSENNIKTEQKSYQSIDPYKYFKITVNNKFRFRRELFNFSDEEMTEALNVALDMQSVEEIEEYFYNDLCFNPENEDVAEFMSIIISHIQK